MIVETCQSTPKKVAIATTINQVSATLKAAGLEDGRAGGEQLRQRELEADHKHEQNDAKLGEKVDAVRGGDNRKAVRADDQAGQKIADNRRKPESLEQTNETRGCDDDDERF